MRHIRSKLAELGPRQAILWGIIFLWIILWAVFHVESFVEEDLTDYSVVKGFTLDQKHAYIIGKDLHDFLLFCKEKLPPYQTFDFKADLEGYRSSRFVYYMYPRRLRVGADYILVYNDSLFSKRAYTTFAKFDKSSRILKRRKEAD